MTSGKLAILKKVRKKFWDLSIYPDLHQKYHFCLTLLTNQPTNQLHNINIWYRMGRWGWNMWKMCVIAFQMT